jgi:Flp pilus assembly protein TadD
MKEISDEQINLAIARTYVAADRFEGAEKFLKRVQELNPANTEVSVLFQKIESQRKGMQ